MGVRTAKITNITFKITKQLPIFCRNLGRVLIPALTTRFKTKNWAAFRLVFLCFLERFLQAEYRFFRFLGLWPFGRMTPPATLFGRLDSSRARLCGPALTTRFKTKKWAAFRLVFLCFLERFLQAEYQRIDLLIYSFIDLWIYCFTVCAI